MFESSLFLSVPSPTSPRTRLAFAAALLLQVTAVALILIVPMLLPARLTAADAPHTHLNLTTPTQPKPILKPAILRAATSPATAPSTPASTQLHEVLTTHGGSGLGHPVIGNGSDEPALNPLGTGMGATPLPGIGLGTGTSGPSVTAAAPASPSTPLNISQGVLAGMLLNPIQPIYPAIAKAAKVQGTVLLAATIDPSGRIINLQVLSGPLMLRTAALEAVQQARYKPYLLNGQPTEVETRITVNFQLGA